MFLSRYCGTQYRQAKYLGNVKSPESYLCWRYRWGALSSAGAGLALIGRDLWKEPWSTDT